MPPPQSISKTNDWILAKIVSKPDIALGNSVGIVYRCNDWSITLHSYTSKVFTPNTVHKLTSKQSFWHLTTAQSCTICRQSSATAIFVVFVELHFLWSKTSHVLLIVIGLVLFDSLFDQSWRKNCNWEISRSFPSPSKPFSYILCSQTYHQLSGLVMFVLEDCMAAGTVFFFFPCSPC